MRKSSSFLMALTVIVALQGTTVWAASTINSSLTGTSSGLVGALGAQTSTPGQVTPGAQIAYTITYSTAAGAAAGSNVTVTILVPINTTFVSATTIAGFAAPVVPVAGTAGDGSTVKVVYTSSAVIGGASATNSIFTVRVNALSSLASSVTIVCSPTYALTTAGITDSSAGNDNPVINTVTQTPIADPAFSITGPIVPLAVVQVGGQAIYALTVSNNGPSDAPNVQLKVDFTLAGNSNLSYFSLVQTQAQATTPFPAPTVSLGVMTTTIANLPPTTGATSCKFNLTTTVKQSAVALSIQLTGSVSGPLNASTLNDSATSTTVTASINSDVVLTIATSPTVGQTNADAGSVLTYVITLTNNGPTNALGVNFTTATPANTTLANPGITQFPAGSFASFTGAGATVGGNGAITGNAGIAIGALSSVQITVPLLVNPATTVGTPLNISASSTSTTADLAPANNTNQTNSPAVNATLKADIAVTGLVGAPNPIVPGAANVTYNFNVVNNGPSNSTVVTLTDSLPAGSSFVTLYQNTTFVVPTVDASNNLTYPIGVMTPGQSLPFTLTISFPSSASNLVSVSNTVTATEVSGDPDLTNNSKTSVLPVTGSADVSIAVIPSVNPVVAGNTLQYTVTIANAGVSDALNVQFAFPFPGPNQAQFSFAGTPPFGWTQTSTNNAGDTTGTYTATTPVLAAGSSVQFQLSFNVLASVTTPLVTTGTVSSTTPDPVPANNSAPTMVAVNPQPTVSVTSISVPEGDVGLSFAMFSFTLSAPNTQVVTVDFTTVDGTAKTPKDYHVTVATVIFQPGDVVQTASIPIVGNTRVELDKTFSIHMSNPVNTTIFLNDATCTIVNDDFGGALAFSVANYTVNETAGTATISVVRGAKTVANNTTVNYATSDGTALAGVDYTAVSGTLTFLGGQTVQTFTIPILNKPGALPDATVNLTLSNPSSGNIVVPGASATLGTPSTAVLTIFARPAINSPLSATVQVGTQFSYTTTATGETGITFTLAPNVTLPDGLIFTPGLGLITGIPTTVGTYSIPIVATNAIGTDTQTLMIQVTPVPAAGTSLSTLDSDGDGFPDEMETFFGSDPLNAKSTPMNIKSLTFGSVNSLKMTISLNFAQRGNDSIMLSGSFLLPADFQQSGKLAYFDIGGVLRQFALDSKGNSTVGNDAAKITLPKSGYGALTVVKFSLAIRNADFQATTPGVLDDEGLTNSDQPGVIRTIPVMILLNSTMYTVNQQQIYTAKRGKSGKTKNP